MECGPPPRPVALSNLSVLQKKKRLDLAFDLNLPQNIMGFFLADTLGKYFREGVFVQA